MDIKVERSEVMSDKEVREIIIDTVPPSDVQPAELIPPKNLLDAEACLLYTSRCV